MPDLCEHYHAIDLAWLRRRKLLEPGRSFSINWSRDDRPTGSVRTLAGSNSLRIGYRRRVPGDWREQVVFFTTTQTRFGGRRQWFECPRCHRPCRVLFGAPFQCRRCHGLHYSSQYASAWSRVAGRLQSLRTRLGGSANLLEPFPPRPKHMRHRTYARLKAREGELVSRIRFELASDLASLERRIGARLNLK